MPPEEARDLVASFEGRRLAAECETYGLADGYQHTEHYVLLEIDGEHPETGEPDVWADTIGVPDKETADMIVAAPTLAAMRAGMREEWGVEATHYRDSAPHTRWGYADRQDAAAFARYMGRDPRWNAARIVRRYITEPEEIE